jgi:hypothetical protein
MFSPISEWTQNYVDGYGLMLCQNPTWKPEGDNGKGDCIGRTVLSGIAYKNLHKRLPSLYRCLESTNPFKLTRHPSMHVNDVSRDHVTYFIIANKLVGDMENLSNYKIPWRLSQYYTQTIDMWLWIRTLAGSKFYSVLFYILQSTLLVLAIIWQKSLRWIAGFRPERTQSEWSSIMNVYSLTPFQLRIRELLGLFYPMYSLHILAWQLYVLPDSSMNRLIKRLMRLIVDRENLLVSMLIGRKVSLEQIEAYKPMNSYRWSTRLDETNDRDIYVLNDPKLYEFNAYDKDILYTIYNQIQEKAEKYDIKAFLGR